MLTLSEAAIISTTMVALLFGFSLLMFILTLWILLRRRDKQRPNYCMILSTCVLESLALGELINNIVHTWRGLLTVGPTFEGGPEQFFEYVKEPTFVLKSVFYSIETLILDGVLIYRTYIVWQSVYVVVLPALGWLSLLATFVGLNVALVTAPEENKFNMFIGKTGRWITAVYSLTISVNLLTSTLLAYRIWKVDREAREYRSGNFLKPVLLAIIESGGIYSATVITALTCFAVKTNGTYIILDMISPIICIVFNMIIVRLGIASRKLLPSILTATQPTTTVENSGSADRRRARPRSEGYQLKALAVEVTRYVETDADMDKDGVDRKVIHSVEDADDIATSKCSPALII